MMETYKNYLHDLGAHLREYALEERVGYQTADPSSKDMCLGRLAAYREVLSLMINQAEVFQINLEDVGLGGFDPDRDLDFG
jgi:hypothetical protein